MKGGQGRAILGLKDLMSNLTIFGSTYAFCAPVKGASKTQMMVTNVMGLVKIFNSLLSVVPPAISGMQCKYCSGIALLLIMPSQTINTQLH